ncbi:Wzz/FepE/Etk N-terminal domain-containing protein [Thorsellia kenyensis]|uniref:Wzz/FepE/Etk N-terminal domain-containing protein n=1 Tax=Thorsellia kenyensis TaxID=1549888 RepID=A0ABV6CBT7_9GAMM
MNPNNSFDTKREILNDELDIKKLFITLWQRKFIILFFTALFAVSTYTFSHFVTPVWTSTAIFKKTSLAKLGNFPQSETIIKSLDMTKGLNEPEKGLTDIVYSEFTQVISSYDFKRQFWLKSDYYAAQIAPLITDHEKSVVLEKLIGDIQFTAKDDRKGNLDTLILKAETAEASNKLLREYIDEANKFIINRIIDELNKIKLNNLSKFKNDKEKLVQAIEQERQKNTNQLLEKKEALKAQLARIQELADSTPEDINDVAQLLQFVEEELSYIEISADEPDIRVQELEIMINELEKVQEINGFDKAFEFLRTPQEPIKADSPRKVFWAFLAALIGGFIGVCVALIQGPKVVKQKTA